MKAVDPVAVALAGVLAIGIGASAQEAPSADAAMAEQMELVKQRTMPNEHHAVLKAFEGTWAYTGSFWMTPDAPAETMTGTAECKMAYGDRFLKQKITGPWMGETFNGLGFIGYDNVKEAYVSTWLDNMGTGIMQVYGTYDNATKTLEFKGTMSCPMTGEKEHYYRSEWAVVDEDHSTYTSYARDAGGKEFKSMELAYSRVK